jgi:hypothetical protein
LRKIQLDSFLPDALRRQTLLPDLTVSSGMASIIGFVLDADEQSRKKSRDREMLRGNGGVDEIKESTAVLSSLFVDRGKHGGLDMTTTTVGMWRCLEGSSGRRSFASGYARTRNE